jgi:hypothetical protein
VKSSSDRVFDKNQEKEFIRSVENDTAKFIGFNHAAARLIGHIEQMKELGHISIKVADLLLEDAYDLRDLARLGHKYVKMVRTPPVEVRTMVLADEERERRLA